MNWGVALIERERVVVSTREPRVSQRVALSRWGLLVGVGRATGGDGGRGREGSSVEGGGKESKGTG